VDDLTLLTTLAFALVHGIGGVCFGTGARKTLPVGTGFPGLLKIGCHLPTFFISTLSQSNLSMPVFLVNSLALSVIMTWMYRRTRGDLLLMLLVHAVANYCGALGVPFNAEVSAEVAGAALIIVGGGLRSRGARGSEVVSVAVRRSDVSVFVGTWIANIEKSRRHANHQFQGATLNVAVSGEMVTLTHGGINASGKQESGTTVLRSDGQDHEVSPLAPGVMVATRWRGAHVLETVAKKDGQVVGDGTYEVSSDGKTLTATVAGTDGAGARFEQVIVFDRG
jgi:hypothetical protein